MIVDRRDASMSCFLFCAFVFTSCGRPAPPDDLVIVNVTVIDGTGAPAQPNLNVHVRKGRIAALTSGPIRRRDDLD